MIRRLNYTGRRRIARSDVTVRLVPSADGVWSFDADFDLADYDFPAQSSVYIEAYNATSYMRFGFGIVGKIEVPTDRRLTDITPTPLPKFRLKIVDRSERHGLLRGVADKVVAFLPEEDLEHRQSLLPVEFHDLGEQIWRLDLTDWPVLELNSRIADLGEVARSADWFLGLVYPEVVRRILHAVVIEQGVNDPDFDDADWTSLWLRFACSLPGVEAPPEGESEDARTRQRDWIEHAVQSFSRAREARKRFERALARAAE